MTPQSTPVASDELARASDELARARRRRELTYLPGGSGICICSRLLGHKGDCIRLGTS